MATDAQIEDLIAAMLDATAAFGDEITPSDMMCATVAICVRWSLAITNSEDDAKSVITILLNDYFAQAAAEDGRAGNA